MQLRSAAVGVAVVTAEVTADPDLRTLLGHGLDALGLEPPAAEVRRLLAYLDLMRRWNRVYNLTAVRDPAGMIPRHLLDSLAVLPALEALTPPAPLLDVGSGAGLPGIPLAIARPDWSVTLLDASAKRVRFLRQVIGELQLGNVEAVQARAEDYQPPRPFANLICRAYTSLVDYWRACRHLCAADGRLLAMKGAWPEPELDALAAAGARVDWSRRLRVPGLAAERHLMAILPEPRPIEP